MHEPQTEAPPIHLSKQAQQLKLYGPQAHSLSVLLGLAYEAHLQLARKLSYEVLSPWQWGMTSACLHPIVPDVIFCMKWIAGEEAVSSLPPLNDAAVLVGYSKLQLAHESHAAAAQAAHP